LLLGFARFYRVLPGFTGFEWVRKGFIVGVWLFLVRIDWPEPQVAGGYWPSLPPPPFTFSTKIDRVFYQVFVTEFTGFLPSFRCDQRAFRSFGRLPSLTELVFFDDEVRFDQLFHRISAMPFIWLP